MLWNKRWSMKEGGHLLNLLPQMKQDAALLVLWCLFFLEDDQADASNQWTWLCHSFLTHELTDSPFFPSRLRMRFLLNHSNGTEEEELDFRLCRTKTVSQSTPYSLDSEELMYQTNGTISGHDLGNILSYKLLNYYSGRRKFKGS